MDYQTFDGHEVINTVEEESSIVDEIWLSCLVSSTCSSEYIYGVSVAVDASAVVPGEIAGHHSSTFAIEDEVGYKTISSLACVSLIVRLETSSTVLMTCGCLIC